MRENPQNVFIPEYEEVAFTSHLIKNNVLVTENRTRLVPTRPAPADPGV